MARYNVLLKNGTVGVATFGSRLNFDGEDEVIGNTLTVIHHDENGNKLKTTGEVVEILSEVANEY